MNSIERESKVITKLLQDTRNSKIIWQKYPYLILKSDKILTMGETFLLKSEGVYITKFKNRIFQIYNINNIKPYNIILELSRENSNTTDIQFHSSSALIDLYEAIRNQESGLISYLDDFLMS